MQEIIECPFCNSPHVVPNGKNVFGGDVKKCMVCGGEFEYPSLEPYFSDDDDDDEYPQTEPMPGDLPDDIRAWLAGNYP